MPLNQSITQTPTAQRLRAAIADADRHGVTKFEISRTQAVAIAEALEVLENPTSLLIQFDKEDLELIEKWAAHSERTKEDFVREFAMDRLKELSFLLKEEAQ